MARPILYQLHPDYPLLFPDPHQTIKDGPACYGGDLSVERLEAAYRLGFFPWYGEEQPILWWHPDPRFVLFPEELKVSKSMRPYFNQEKYVVRYDTRFRQVMEACRDSLRPGQWGSWITKDLIEGFVALHAEGLAHSIEVYDTEDQLVGGLYGLAIGKVFFGESMFFLKPNASKFGFISLVRRLHAQGFNLIDCQQETQHLASLGARSISRKEFIDRLSNAVEWPAERGPWTEE